MTFHVLNQSETLVGSGCKNTYRPSSLSRYPLFSRTQYPLLKYFLSSSRAGSLGWIKVSQFNQCSLNFLVTSLGSTCAYWGSGGSNSPWTSMAVAISWKESNPFPYSSHGVYCSFSSNVLEAKKWCSYALTLSTSMICVCTDSTKMQMKITKWNLTCFPHHKLNQHIKQPHVAVN